MTHFFGRPQSTQTVGGVGAALINLGGAAAGLGTSCRGTVKNLASWGRPLDSSHCNWYDGIMPTLKSVTHISVAVSGQASCSRDGGLVEGFTVGRLDLEILMADADPFLSLGLMILSPPDSDSFAASYWISS